MTVLPKEMEWANEGKKRSITSTKKREGTPLSLFALIASLASGASFYLAGGHALFHTPTHKQVVARQQIANQMQFRLDNVTTRVDTGHRLPVFVIRGDIKAFEKGGVIPNLTVSFFNKHTGKHVAYTIPRGERLQANQTLEFATRIPADALIGLEPTVKFEGS